MAIDILTDAHRKLAEELLSGKPRAHIARDLAVSRNTIYEWMRDPLWQAYFQKLAGERESAQSARMVITVMKAGEVMDAYLEKLLASLENPGAEGTLASLPGVETVSQVFKRLVELQRLDAGQPTEHKRVDTSGSPESRKRGTKVKGALDRMMERETTEEEPETTH